ncbi:hypothetical protein SISSUDRAFT_802228 [Sistotremastrum suecicum HHB10207 ss-3]|uniref:Uncharacterized protein n=1 Tax=Sistotremastrum suecicum HHB10207 ss-3 TaxID=1314776 RepID=A0A166HRR5_9AGAM|nr:hypothetical protein SISSUDRAFT_802228 [Sistotremastrum suecicum HHB10207 ss-3]
MAMLSSPMRQCIFTQQYLPTDFMIRMSVLKIPSDKAPSNENLYLLPDGVLHPRFKSLSSRVGRYLVCKKSVVPHLEPRKSVYRARPGAGEIRLHAMFEEQVGSMLRERVIQELELLADRVRCVPKKFKTKHLAQDMPVVRRLHRDEFADMRSSSKMMRSSLERVALVMVLPPIREASVSVAVEEIRTSSVKAEAARETDTPILEMINVQAGDAIEESTEAQERIPWYNCVPMFPERTQRERLHTAMLNLLGSERKRLWRIPSTEKREGKPKAVKHSHAIVLSSWSTVNPLPDVTPLSIALWRVAMWEGCTPEGTDWYTN